ncbi:hypothetical protein BC826DRAFT_1084697 [Russula brevipes]|nr:hypothetical protein BC826DRAFT_1084697 [Russula brevipes]
MWLYILQRWLLGLLIRTRCFLAFRCFSLLPVGLLPALLLPMLHISRATQHFAGVLATRTCPRQPLRPFLAARLALRSPSWLSIGWDDS